MSQCPMCGNQRATLLFRQTDRLYRTTDKQFGIVRCVQCGLLLRGGKRPRGSRAALLTEHEAQLWRRTQLGLVGTERRARLLQLQGAQEIDPEEALIAADFGRGSLGSTPARCTRHLYLPPN